jgi:DNA polymerase III delta prime subunit
MDTTTLFLFEKIRRNEDINYKEIFNYIILIPLISFILTNFSNYISNLQNYFKYNFHLFRKKGFELILEGSEVIHKERGVWYDYPRSIIALVYFIKQKNLNLSYKKINCSELGGLLITDCDRLLIDKDISLSIKREKIDDPEKNNFILYQYILKSSTVNLVDFINKLIEDYDENICNKEKKTKLFHYIYKGESRFSRNCVSDLKSNPNLETFDKIYNENKDQIMKDIDRLKDIEYYKKTGLKRKKGYLFYGEPGCGKTSTVMAMANYDNRNIIEVPLSRIKTNSELEDIINLKIEGIEIYEKKEVIILFDELDCAFDSVKKRLSNIISVSNKSEKKDENEKDNQIISKDSVSNTTSITFDNLNIGSILSRLDGIGNYNGLIIVATTNHKENLDPALYRELRLTPIEFSFCRKEDMVNMIESFYEIKLSEKDKNKIPDRNAKITPAKFRYLLELFENNYKDLLHNFQKIT